MMLSDLTSLQTAAAATPPQQTPDVSIIIPACNVINGIARALLSAITQEGCTLEVIVVDNGSSDATPELCEQYAAQWPQLIKVLHLQHTTLGAALNCGCTAARGEYLVFLAGMDFISTRFCSRLRELCITQGSDIGHGRASCIECDTGKECAGAAAHLSSCYDNSSLVYADNLWAWLYRRSFILQHQLSFDEELAAGIELDFRCRSLLQCQSCSACEEVTYFCQHTPWAVAYPDQRLNSAQIKDIKKVCLSIASATEHGQGPDDLVRAFCYLNCLEKLHSASRQAAEQSDAHSCRELLSLLETTCPRHLFQRIGSAVAQARQP